MFSTAFAKKKGPFLKKNVHGEKKSLMEITSGTAYSNGSFCGHYIFPRIVLHYCQVPTKVRLLSFIQCIPYTFMARRYCCQWWITSAKYYCYSSSRTKVWFFFEKKKVFLRNIKSTCFSKPIGKIRSDFHKSA